MKKFFYLFLVLPTVLFSQKNQEKYDYFVQFNTPQFAKKVNIDELIQGLNEFKDFYQKLKEADFKEIKYDFKEIKLKD